jgi:hypothetical protein
MIRSNRVKIVSILFFFLSVYIFSQEKQMNDDKDKKLRNEILSVYQSKGEQGLRDFVQSNTDKIANKFIVDFAELGVKERSEEWLKTCENLADVKNDEKSLADVYCKMGGYFFEEAKSPKSKSSVYMRKGDLYLQTGNNVIALEMYDKSLQFVKEAEDILGQAKVFSH